MTSPDFEYIPDTLQRFESLKEEVIFFLDTCAQDVADSGHPDFAKALCLELAFLVTSTYNQIDVKHSSAN